MQRLFVNAMAVVLVTSGVAVAQSKSVTVPADAKFVVHLDLKQFKKTKLGGKIFEMAKAEAMKELKESFGGDGNSDTAERDPAKKIEEALGLDPFTELDGFTIVGSDFEDPEDSLRVVLKLRKTTGNLEGLMLGLPGYSSTEHGKYEIHSAAPDDDERVFGAIHSDDSGTKRVVAGRTKNAVVDLLAMLDGKAEGKKVDLTGDDDAFVHVELLQLPLEELGEGPQANVAKLLKGIKVRVGDDDGDLRVSLLLTTSDEKRAKQLKQMIQGLTAMLSFIEDADEEIEMAKDLLDDLKVKRDGNKVQIRLTIPEKQLKLIMEEAEISLELGIGNDA